MRDISVVPEPQGQGKVAILVAIEASIVLLSILPRLNGFKAGRTELGGLHHYGRRMTFTGGKRSSAVQLRSTGAPFRAMRERRTSSRQGN